jgi:predicted anti-sigma-YlaC factor YlaD
MDCDACRLDVSARLDGEPTAATADELDAHLRSCQRCRALAEGAAELAPRLAPLAASAAPSRSVELLTAMAEARRTAGRRLDAVRLALLVVAGIQLGLALPGLLFGDAVAGMAAHHVGHVTRHLGAWDVALAVGFVVAAVQPVRALGLLPMAVALAACMAVAAVLDVVGGSATLFGESMHALQLTGLALLWALSRATPRPTAIGSAAWATP